MKNIWLAINLKYDINSIFAMTVFVLRFDKSLNASTANAIATNKEKISSVDLQKDRVSLQYNYT